MEVSKDSFNLEGVVVHATRPSAIFLNFTTIFSRKGRNKVLQVSDNLCCKDGPGYMKVIVSHHSLERLLSLVLWNMSTLR